MKHVPKDEYAVFIFGSRADGTSRWNSDIDLGLLGKKPFPISELVELKEELAQSHVPYDVDVIDFFDVKKNFREEALKNIILWNQPGGLSLSSMI